MKITRKSPFTGKEVTKDINITQEQYERWLNQEDLIQNIMPNISADDREFIISGITSEEWDDAFSEDED